MKQKLKRRPRFWAITIILFILIVPVVAVMANLPKHQYVSDSSFDLTALADGTFEGQCDNGLVFVRVEVDVQNHTIVNVRILEHRNGKGEPAEQIADSVTRSQSIEVDAVSGATYSSQTILKAIENALSK
jgi:uncharacterized protein with FMN-binding domain